MKILTAAFAAMAAFLFAGTPVLACSQTGVWKGTWHSGIYNGPIEMTVDHKLGYHYVSIRESNQNGRWSPAKTYRYTPRGSVLKVAAYTLNQSGCQLTGTQRHSQAGTVNVNLQWVSNAPNYRTPAFLSVNQAQRHVIGRTYAGQWTWGPYTAVRQVTFGQSGGNLVAQVTEGSKRSKVVFVTRSHDWLTYTYNLDGKTITANILVTKAGDVVEVRLRKNMILFADMSPQ